MEKREFLYNVDEDVGKREFLYNVDEDVGKREFLYSVDEDVGKREFLHNVDDDVEKREFLYIVDGNETGAAMVQKQCGSSSKTGKELPYDPAIALLGTHLKKMKTI